MVSLVLLDMPPRPEVASSTEGYLINMYVDREHRNRGIGEALLRSCQEGSPRLGLRKLLLHTTAAGQHLYEKSGFELADNFMELRFDFPRHR